MAKISRTQGKENNSINLDAALLDAARRGDLGRVSDLLDRGADVNATDNNGRTPLILFMESGHIQFFSPLYVLSLFTQRGVKINAQDKNGDTALHAAAKDGFLSSELLETFVKFGGDIEALNYPPGARTGGKTPLQVAATSGYLTASLLESFYSEKTNLNIRDSKGRSIADLSAGSFDVSLFRMFAKYGIPGVHPAWEHDLNARDRAGNTALTWCAANGMFAYDTNLLEGLLAEGADPNGANDDGEDFLMVLAKRMSVFDDYVDAFLRWGGNANRKNKSGENLLFFVYPKEPVKKLLAHGADPNARSLSGMTPLIKGISGEFYYDTALELYRGGADPTQGWGTETPLFLCLSKSPSGIGLRFMAELLTAGYSVRDLLGTDDMRLFRKKLGEKKGDSQLSPVPAKVTFFALCGLYGEKFPARESRLSEYMEQYTVYEGDLRDVLDSLGDDVLELMSPALASGVLETITALYEHPALVIRMSGEELFEWDPRKVKAVKLLLSCLSGDDKDRSRETAVRFIEACLPGKELEKWSVAGIEGMDKLVSALAASLRNGRGESLKDSSPDIGF